LEIFGSVEEWKRFVAGKCCGWGEEEERRDSTTSKEVNY
jgi:hypothetical protein